MEAVQVPEVRLPVRGHALPAFLEQARASRNRVRAAMGSGPQSGTNLIWNAKLQKDLETVRNLARELPDATETYQRFKPQELEDKLVEVHALAARVGQIRNKYEAALAPMTKIVTTSGEPVASLAPTGRSSYGHRNDDRETKPTNQPRNLH